MFKRPEVHFLLFAFACFAVLTLVLNACGTQGNKTFSHHQPTRGGTWIDDILSAPGALLPQEDNTTYSILIGQAISTPLFYGDASGQVHPGLAAEIPTVANGGASADLKRWTFKLRPSLKWSDGQPLNVDDLIYSFQTYQNPTFGAKSTTGFNDITSMSESADKLTLTMQLNKPEATFVSNFIDANPGAPLPAHIFSHMKPADILKSPDSQLPHVTNGPFLIDQVHSTAQQQYVLVRNPYYYQPGLPYLDKIVFRVVNNPGTIIKDAQAGQITSSWFIDPSQIDAYKAVSGYTVVTDKVSAGYEALWMNENNPALKDATVRKAIAMAIDHNKLIAAARNGFASNLCTDHPTALVPGYQAHAPCPPFDPAAANILLNQHGWLKGADGVRSKNGLRLDFNYTTTPLAWHKIDQAIVQQNLQAIGIKTTLVNQPGSTFFSTTLPQGKPGVYDIAEYALIYAYDADDSGALSCASIPLAANNYGGGNTTFWCDHATDALFNQELSTTDPAIRQDAFNKLHQIYLTEFPFITEYGLINASIVKSSGRNYAPGPMGAAETVNVWDWWCAGGQC